MCYFCCVSILHLTTIRLYAEGFNTYFPRVLRGGIFIWRICKFTPERIYSIYWKICSAPYAEASIETRKNIRQCNIFSVI